VPLWEPSPGETPIDDVSGLKVKGLRTRSELNLVEAENVRQAHIKYFAAKPSRRTAPFDFSWSLRLHKEMFGRVWKWAGTLRTSDLNIGVPSPQVESRLYALLDDLAFWQHNGMSPSEQAVLLHHRAVYIHPFLNGNGRWSRMLANIRLKACGEPILIWPEETIGAESPIRREYLEAVKQADEGNYEPLTELHSRLTQKNG
jgi:Fic-DOC domain mobile mystery protein B